MKTAAISFGAALALLSIYATAFLNRTQLERILPSDWYGSFEIIFRPAELIRQKIDHHRIVKEWRVHKGTWVATYPDDFQGTFEVVEFESGRFQIRSADQTHFVEDVGSELLLDPGGGALLVSETHSTQILPPNGFLFMRVFTLPLDGRPPVEYVFERSGNGRSEQAAKGKGLQSSPAL